MTSVTGTIRPAYLIGNTSAESTVATWVAVTDGSFTISLEGTAYNITALDFSSATTMAGVATIIQTGVQAAAGSQTVTWDSDRGYFKIASVTATTSSVVSIATAYTSGTDISGYDTDTSHYLDCYNAKTQPYERVMALSDLYANVNAEVEDTLNKNLFIADLNEGYKRILSKIYDIDPNFELDYLKIDLNTSYNVYTIPSECLTIERVYYYASSTSDTETVVPITEFDEKIEISGLRWFRQGKTIVFRGNTKDIDDVYVYYRPKATPLLVDADVPAFSDNDYHTILLYYVKYKYFFRENMETDFRIYLQLFENALAEMVQDIEPDSEPKRMRILYEIGIP